MFTDLFLSSIPPPLLLLFLLLACCLSSFFGLGKMWAGGCSQQPGSNWHWYCLNRQLYYTGAGYMRKASDTRFAAQRAGFFKVVFCKD